MRILSFFLGVLVAILVFFRAPLTQAFEASESAFLGVEATTAAVTATPAATLVERVVEKKPDLTETQGVVKGKLQRYLESQTLGSMEPTNVLRYAIRAAVQRGVPANTIVLILLFPLVTAIIAASRHLIGLRGFGIFTPAVLSVAFVATGVVTGIALFAVILTVAMVGRAVLNKMRLQYLPRMALLMWAVALGVLGTLFLAPYLAWQSLVQINIFPILILILLAENFMEVQVGKSRREATELMVETILLALICSLMLSLDAVQKFALLYPEFLIGGVAVFNVFMGRYIGLRLTEYLKFQRLLQ